MANNARDLSNWLRGATGKPVEVTPILTIPGWMVDRQKPVSNVQVLNPKEIVGSCRGSERRLTPDHVEQIRYQLEQKCRLEVEKPAGT